MNAIKQYDAYFTFSRVDSALQAKIREIVRMQELDVDVSDSSLEFRFVGRDLSDYVIRSFTQIAAVLGDADGEMRCEIDDEEQDPTFMFYTISKSQLWQQPAKIVRSSQKQAVANIAVQIEGNQP